MGISALNSGAWPRRLMRLDRAPYCSMDDARAVDEQSAWVTWPTTLLAYRSLAEPRHRLLRGRCHA